MIFKNIVQNKKGFTLIEVIIYIAVSATMLMAVVSLMQQFLMIRNKVTVTAKVQQNARYAMARMIKEIKDAEDLNVIDQNTLRLTVEDPLRNPVLFDLQNGVLYMREGLDDPVAITGNDVKVGDVLFEDRTTPNSADIVKITLLVTNPDVSKTSDSQASVNLNTYVARR